MQKIPLCLLCFCIYANSLFGQDFKSESVQLSIINVGVGFHIPGGDLSKRFGPNATIGAAYNFKTKSNWYLGAEANFIFGTNIRETGILQGIASSKGEILDEQGQVSKVLFLERGYTAMATFGRLFPFLGVNPNSGLLIKGGLGIMQHKLLIQNQNNRVPQIDGEYEKGYDRLTNGLVSYQFIGYNHMSNSRLANFFIGLEFYQGYTQGKRDYNYDTRSIDKAKRLDLLYGIKLGWCLPLYKRIANDYFIN